MSGPARRKGRGRGEPKSMLRPRGGQVPPLHEVHAKSAKRSGMEPLSGKHVVVTGGGKGMGKAIAERLAGEGAALSLLAPNLDELEDVAERGGGAPHACDTSARAGVAPAFAAAAEARGPIHALVANSGIGGANADGP